MKELTFLLFMAADCDLYKVYAKKDLEELIEIGSSRDINVVIQLDHLGYKTERYYVKKGKIKSVEKLSKNVDVTEPEILREFLKWGVLNYPARRFIPVIWGHGFGVKDYTKNRIVGIISKGRFKKFIGAPRRIVSKNIIRKYTSIPQMDMLFRESERNYVLRSMLKVGMFSEGMFSEGMFSEGMFPKGMFPVGVGTSDVLYKIISKELTIQELAYSFSNLPNKVHFDSIGFDSCLMAMLEIVYQLKDTCKSVIGSEEEEPSEGWPYHKILAGISKSGDIRNQLTEDITKKIVDTYINSIEKRHATQSVILTKSIEGISEQVNELSGIILKKFNIFKGLLENIDEYNLQRFKDRDYVDLYHLVEIIRNNINDEGIIKIAGKLLEKINDTVYSKNIGSKTKNAHGMSILFSLKNLNNIAIENYKKLDFTKKYGNWFNLIQQLS